MQALKGVIFDLDGTLLNTLTSLANCFNRALSSLSYPTHEVDAYRHFIGDGARQCVIRTLPEQARNEMNIHKLLTRQQDDYQVNWHRDVSIYPGVHLLLKNLSAQPIKIGVLSNKDHRFTEQCVGHFFPDISFDAVQGFAPPLLHKPDPAGALAIADLWQLDTSQIAFVGDTAMDVATAVASGMLPIGVLWGFRGKEELQLAGAKHLVSQAEELLSIINTGGQVQGRPA